jgi:hypothetical protein
MYHRRKTISSFIRFIISVKRGGVKRDSVPEHMAVASDPAKDGFTATDQLVHRY